MAREYKKYDPATSDHPPYFTGETGPRGGPMWQAPTYGYHGPMEVAPEVHGLAEGGGKYYSQIHPQIGVDVGKGHTVSVQQQHPRWVEDVRQRYPDKNIPHFEVKYYHEGDNPAFEGTRREDLRELFKPEDYANYHQQFPQHHPVSHSKAIYAGDDPREAQKAAVQAVTEVHRHVFNDRRNEGRRQNG